MSSRCLAEEYKDQRCDLETCPGLVPSYSLVRWTLKLVQAVGSSIPLRINHKLKKGLSQIDEQFIRLGIYSPLTHEQMYLNIFKDNFESLLKSKSSVFVKVNFEKIFFFEFMPFSLTLGNIHIVINSKAV